MSTLAFHVVLATGFVLACCGALCVERSRRVRSKTHRVNDARARCRSLGKAVREESPFLLGVLTMDADNEIVADTMYANARALAELVDRLHTMGHVDTYGMMAAKQMLSLCGSRYTSLCAPHLEKLVSHLVGWPYDADANVMDSFNWKRAMLTEN